MKPCATCKKEKPISDFNRHPKKESGWDNCKACMAEKRKAKKKAATPMCYKDYLRQQGLEKYYKKMMKYRI